MRVRVLDLARLDFCKLNLFRSGCAGTNVDDRTVGGIRKATWFVFIGD